MPPLDATASDSAPLSSSSTNLKKGELAWYKHRAPMQSDEAGEQDWTLVKVSIDYLCVDFRYAFDMYTVCC